LAQRLGSPCRHPGCPNLAVRGGYCVDHQSEQAKRPVEGRRGSARERGYTRAWERLRAYVLRTEPLCRPCQERGIIRPATLVHHLDPISDGHPNLPSLDRLVPMCDECHGRAHCHR
jgi:5-methylcytosine-specific restriction protein A